MPYHLQATSEAPSTTIINKINQIIILYMDLTTHLSGIDMARIVNVKFLIFIILFLISIRGLLLTLYHLTILNLKILSKNINKEMMKLHILIRYGQIVMEIAEELLGRFNEEDAKKMQLIYVIHTKDVINVR